MRFGRWATSSVISSVLSSVLSSVIFFLATTSFGADPSLVRFFNTQLTPHQIFELSSLGSLKKLSNHGYTKLDLETATEMSALRKFRARSTYKDFPLPFFSRFYIQTDAPDWTIPKNDFSIPLMDLMQDLKKNGISTLSLDEVMAEADRKLRDLRSEGKIGGLYYGYRFSRVDREERFIIDLPLEAENEIQNLFQKPTTQPEISDFEKAALKSESLTSDELFELKQLRKATQIFSQNSAFFDQPGGWKNNVYFPYSSPPSTTAIIAYCGEHTCTMLEFAKQIEARGKIESFETVGRVIKDHILNNHAAAVLRNRRTKKLFVLDSWLVPGGSEAKILPFDSWALWRYDTHEITSLTCPDLLRPLTQIKKRRANTLRSQESLPGF